MTSPCTDLSYVSISQNPNRSRFRIVDIPLRVYTTYCQRQQVRLVDGAIGIGESMNLVRSASRHAPHILEDRERLTGGYWTRANRSSPVNARRSSWLAS